MQRTIMITGVGSGMGRELLERARTRGDLVIAAVFSRTEMESWDTGPNVHLIEIDVGSTASVADAFARADAILAERPLQTIVHCAGIAPSGAIEVEPIDTLERALNVNTMGTARIIKAALPRLRGHGGRLLLFSSLWGKVGGPLLSAYCASKHAIEAIVDSTRREIAGQAIDISLIEPGVVRTNMVSQTVTGSRFGSDELPPPYRPIYGDIYARFARMIARESTGGSSVEQAADIIEKAMFAQRPKTRYTIGKDAAAVTALARLLPDRALDAVFRQMLARH